MNYRLNQIAMAVLGALLLFFGARTLVNIAYEEHEPGEPGYTVSGSEEHPGGGEVKPSGGDLATLLTAADPTRGADVAKKCAICHNFDKGGPNLIGPNLYGVLGRKIASHEGYEYSAVLKSKEGDWDYEKINHMIENPNAFAPGTKMALFPGLPDAKQRADVLVFLRTKNDHPPALPEPTAGGGAAAGGEERPGGATAGGEAAGGGGSEVIALLATADPKQGEADAALCKICHTFNKGGAALIGPNLYDVVGRKIASVEGFNYTPALKAHEGEWTYDKLDPWLKNPQAFAAGTMMAFPGLPDAKKRADVIAFLRMNSDNPKPLPEPAAAMPPAAPAETAPAAAAPAAETPAPAAETPAPPAETPAPSAETPAPAAETPAPAAETPAPAAETPAPPAETPAPAAETPAPPAETPAPSAETPAPPAETAPEPSAETPAAPAETPPAATEEPAVVPEELEKVIEETEDNPPTSEPSAGEGPYPSQPQPVYPEGKPEGVE